VLTVASYNMAQHAVAKGTTNGHTAPTVFEPMAYARVPHMPHPPPTMLHAGIHTSPPLHRWAANEKWAKEQLVRDHGRDVVIQSVVPHGYAAGPAPAPRAPSMWTCVRAYDGSQLVVCMRIGARACARASLSPPEKGTHSQWLVRPCAFRSIRTEAARLTDETERRAMTHDARFVARESIASTVGRQTVDRLRTRIACRYGRGAPKWVPMQEHIESVGCPRAMLRQPQPQPL
jgi:hypothetical protein